jgi:hypothetical protein
MSLSGCGGGNDGDPSQPSAVQPSAATAVVAAPPAAAPEPENLAPHCARGPLVPVAPHRAHPRVVLGRTHVAIVHDARRRATPDDEACEAPRVVSETPLPMREGAFTETGSTPICEHNWRESAQVISVDALLAGDDLQRVACRFNVRFENGDAGEGNLFECRIVTVGDPADNYGEGFRVTDSFYISPLRRQELLTRDTLGERGRVRIERLTVGDFSVMVVAFNGLGVTSGVYGLVTTQGRSFETGRIGFAPSGDIEDEQVYAFELAASEAGGFVLTHGPRRGPRRTRVPFDAGGRPGEREVYEGVVPPPAFDVVVERGTRGVPPKLRVARDGVVSPLSGISESDGAFSPSLVRVGEHLVLAWSEGLNDATRIRAAVIDPDRGSVVGPITELSTPGVEAGFVTLAAHGERLVASWDERTNGSWQVVAAELTCE